MLVLSNGELVTVEFVQHEILESPIKVYNFEVEDFHTYFVGEQSVFVHNGCGDDLAKPGEDLYVGTYSKSKYANKKSGLNSTHTPHHAVQDAISPTSHGKGITINLRKDLHELTGTYKKRRNIDPNDLRKNLAADIGDLRSILKDAGYDSHVINRQLRELIRQNKATGKFNKR